MTPHGAINMRPALLCRQKKGCIGRKKNPGIMICLVTALLCDLLKREHFSTEKEGINETVSRHMVLSQPTNSNSLRVKEICKQATNAVPTCEPEML